jgi:hypothetical protein
MTKYNCSFLNQNPRSRGVAEMARSRGDGAESRRWRGVAVDARRLYGEAYKFLSGLALLLACATNKTKNKTTMNKKVDPEL